MNNSPEELKNYFNDLVKTYKRLDKRLKAESAKPNKNEASFTQLVNEINLINFKLSDFNDRYGGFIKKRKNSFGKFSEDMYRASLDRPPLENVIGPAKRGPKKVSAPKTFIIQDETENYENSLQQGNRRLKTNEGSFHGSFQDNYTTPPKRMNPHYNKNIQQNGNQQQRKSSVYGNFHGQGMPSDSAQKPSFTPMMGNSPYYNNQMGMEYQNMGNYNYQREGNMHMQYQGSEQQMGEYAPNYQQNMPYMNRSDPHADQYINPNEFYNEGTYEHYERNQRNMQYSPPLHQSNGHAGMKSSQPFIGQQESAPNYNMYHRKGNVSNEMAIRDEKCNFLPSNANHKQMNFKEDNKDKNILDGKNLDDILGDIKLSEKAKEYINEMCDVFIENICYSSCIISRNRNSHVLDVEDIKLAMKSEYNINFAEIAFERKGYNSDAEHEKKIANIEKEIYKRSKM